MHPTILLANAPSTEHSSVLALLTVLAAAAAVTMTLRRVKLATIPGYLITGALIGPFGLVAFVDAVGPKLGIDPSGGLWRFLHLFSVTDGQSINEIKDLAVILLMFTVGLHLDLAALGRGLVQVSLVGILSTLGAVGLLSVAAMALGASAPTAIAVGMAMSMSSTAVVLRLLQQKRETHRLHGRLCVAISIVQDLMSLVMLALMPLLATWGGKGLETATHEQLSMFAMVRSGVIALTGIAALVGFGRFVLPMLLQESSKEPSGESTLVLCSAVALGAAVLTAGLGFSPELGAFMAGFLLASTPFRYQLAGQLSPMRDLFMAVFFTAVGLKLNFGTIASSWWVILLGLPLLVILKAGAIGVTTWLAGATAPVAGRVGLSLAQAGEFSIVVLGVASLRGVTDPQVEGIVIAITVLSLIITPNLYDWAVRLQPRLATLPTVGLVRNNTLCEQGTGEGAAESGEGGGAVGGAVDATRAPLPKARRAIIAGFGVIGRAVADHLEVKGVPYTLVELNAQTVATQRKLGRKAVYGDIGNPEVLESAGVHDADAVFLTIPDDEAIVRACQNIRNLAPHVFIAARTGYLSTAFQATSAGADDVTVAEVTIAEAMAKRVLQRLASNARADVDAAAQRGETPSA